MRKLGDFITSRVLWLASFVGSLLQRGKPNPPNLPVSRPMRASPSLILDDQTLTAWFQANQACPDCGGLQFVDGPQGGLSKNIRCANLLCSSQYNVAQIQGHVLFAQRIHWQHPAQRSLH